MNMNDSLSKLMQEAEKMQSKMQEAQAELSSLSVTGESGGGMVKVTMNGLHNVPQVKISKALMDEDVSMIEDLVAAAVNDAVARVEKVSKEKIAKLTSGFNLPTDFLKSDE
jgi:DNA-binding YbaB/EbfC family protein